MSDHQISIDEIGRAYALDGEAYPARVDNACYCERCEYRREKQERVINNFFYGVAFFPLWIYNITIYIHLKRLDNDYQASRSLTVTQLSQLRLLNDEEDLDNLTYQIVAQHELTAKLFDRWCGWSALALFVIATIACCAYLIL